MIDNHMYQLVNILAMNVIVTIAANNYHGAKSAYTWHNNKKFRLTFRFYPI